VPLPVLKPICSSAICSTIVFFIRLLYYFYDDPILAWQIRLIMQKFSHLFVSPFWQNDCERLSPECSVLDLVADLVRDLYHCLSSSFNYLTLNASKELCFACPCLSNGCFDFILKDACLLFVKTITAPIN